MDRLIKLIAVVVSTSLCMHAFAESKQVQVYDLSQTYVDVHHGDTLGEIAAELLPHNHAMQQQLIDDIIRMNPDVFPDSRADRMLADRRLFLPNTMNQADSKPDTSRYRVESYSWGNVKRAR